MKLSPGKSASTGEELVERRARITASMVDLALAHVLDYGCGNGVQTDAVRKQAGSIVGVDLDYPHYDGKTLPFSDGSFDAVVSYQVLEHVQDERQSLAEMRRVLKLSGKLLLSVPNRWWIFETHGWCHRIPFVSWLPKKLHDALAVARIYDRRSIVGLLESCGFIVRDVRYMVAPMDRAPQRVRGFLRRHIFRRDTTRNPFVATEIFILCSLD